MNTRTSNHHDDGESPSFRLSLQDGTVIAHQAKSIKFENGMVDADGQLFDLKSPIFVNGFHCPPETSFFLSAKTHVSGSINPFGSGPVELTVFP